MTMFNPAPGAEAPFTSNSTETVMMSYGGSPNPKQMLDRIAMLERENAHLSSADQSREDMPDFMPVDTAPKDGTMLRLFVRFDQCSLEDGDHPQWTMGFNDKRNTEIDEWNIVGWSWTHDCFVEVHTAQVLGWLPFIRAMKEPT